MVTFIIICFKELRPCINERTILFCTMDSWKSFF